MATETGRSAHTPRVAGAHIGPFVLDRFLGGGGDTEVWRADGDGIVVALKLVRDRSDPIAVARLAHEALALDLVRHPAVAHRFDADDSDGESWLATALLEGGTLAQHLTDGLLDATRAAAALAPIAEALDEAHRVGVVHRDVNPSNIVLSTDGPVLIDFGHAAIGGHTWDGWTVTGASAVARTQGFTAPESEVSPALDVYSLGITLLEAVTGRRSVDAVEASARRSGRRILDLVNACCVKDAARRPTATEVAARLRAIAGATSAPRQPSPPVIVDVVSAEFDEGLDRGGRSSELERLTRVARRALDNDELGALLVVAPAGTGKSWLLDRALDTAHRELDLPTRRTRCTTDVGDLRVLRPIVEPDLDNPRLGAAAAAVLRGAIGTHGASAEASPREVADAVAAVLRLGPMAVLVDDLHWADGALVEVLAMLAFRRATPGALFLGTRPGFIDPDDLDVETLALGPLDELSLRAALADVADDDVVAAAAALAGGNPLHAREAALALAAGVELEHASDLRGVVAARLSAVDVRLTPALELAAVSGDTFWPEIVGEDLRALLPQMVRAGYARPRLRSSLSGTTEFEWSHPLLREVAYEGLAPEDRRRLHARLARRLDTCSAVDPETVARHAGVAFRLGEHALAELTAHHAAASVREALDHYAVGRAADWAELLRETEHDSDLADVLTAEVKNRQGDFTGALDLLLPHTHRDDDIGTRALTIGTETLVGTGDYQRAVEWGDLATRRTGDTADQIRLARPVAMAWRALGDLERALSDLDSAAAAARSSGDLLLAARLASDATTTANMTARMGTLGLDPIHRAQRLFAELTALKDSRGLIEFACSTAVDSIGAEDPQLAHTIQMQAFESVRDLNDPVREAVIAERLVEAAWGRGPARHRLVGTPVARRPATPRDRPALLRVDPRPRRSVDPTTRPDPR